MMKRMVKGEEEAGEEGMKREASSLTHTHSHSIPHVSSHRREKEGVLHPTRSP